MERSITEILQGKPDWKRVEIEPKLWPEAVATYNGGRGQPPVADMNDERKLKVEQHIVALGWIIESERHGIVRYISPDRKVYSNLPAICKVVLDQEEKARAGSGAKEPIKAKTNVQPPKAPPIWKRVDIEPKLWPEVVATYNGSRGHCGILEIHDERELKAKQHLVALGWVIESDNHGSLRYISPNKKVYHNLFEICRLVTEQEETARAGRSAEEPTKAKTNVQQPPKERIWKRVDIEPKLWPEVVATYNGSRGHHVILEIHDERVLKAKQHLVALGWVIESDNQGFLRYISPDKKVYHNLLEICRLVTEQEGKARAGSSTEKPTKVKMNVQPPKPGWEDAKIEPIPCPEALVRYAREGKSEFRRKAAQHIVSLGWIIETNEHGRTRIRKPYGIMYYSLREVCRFLVGQDAKHSKAQ